MDESNKMLSYDEQIEWLKKNSITIKDEKECKHYLKYNTYFYKLIGFVKDFNNNGHYEIKTFDELRDIATLDMELRYELLCVS